MDYVLDFQEIDRSDVAAVGGKGALLGELSQIDGISVPPGFCVRTDVFEQLLAGAPLITDLLARLSRLRPQEGEAIGALCAEIRQAVEAIEIPDALTMVVTGALGRLDERSGYAVRSSATAEDLPSASFAGQYDSYLGVAGPKVVLEHIRRCWASLFSDRAVTYRLRNGFDQRAVLMAVVVQQMVSPQAAGIMFTADPVTGNRKVASVEAVAGIGEGLVSGLVNPEVFRVRDGELLATGIAGESSGPGHSHGEPADERVTALEPANRPVLTDAQVRALVRLGRRIESHLGGPQDIEWCLADGRFWVVQSRPITTLFPIPEVADQGNHVYVSVGHGQMMTDAMKPLGISVWQLTAMAPMLEAGSRLFVDVTRRLAWSRTRDGLLALMEADYPLIGDALRTVVEREGFLTSFADQAPEESPARVPSADQGSAAATDPDPAIVGELMERNRLSLAALERDIRTRSGPALFDFLLDAFEEHKRILSDPQSLRVIMAGRQATRWLNERIETWLGEKNAADAFALTGPGNVTSEMGLALLDVADVIREHPPIVAFLQRVAEGDCADADFLDKLGDLPDGREAQAAISAYLERYGVRCVGEIDITRPRWSERPAMLVPLILDNVNNFSAGEAQRRVTQGHQAADRKQDDLLRRLRESTDGEQKAHAAARMIDCVRNFCGYREYPKYGIVARYFVYKQAILQEAERLVQTGVLRDKEDIFYLTFHELRDVVMTNHVDQDLIAGRRDLFRFHQGLTPPPVMTSDGEIIAGTYRRDDAPAGALIGLPVSGGTVQGRARVIRDITQAKLECGDILVTTYTDPSWTPLFLTVSALVTEVGGLMTHGAVIAREYGLPAVVGVPNATNLIRDGQQIRVHGMDGYVEILSDSDQERRAGV